MSNHSLHNIFLAINLDNIELAESLINNINIHSLDINNLRGYNSLKIKIMIIKNTTRELEAFFNKTSNLMSRDYINFVEYINNISQKRAEIFFQENVLNNIKLKSKDIKKLIEINNHNILKMLIGTFNRTELPGDKIMVKEHFFEKEFLQPLIKNIVSDIDSKIIYKIKNKHYDYIIDGGNVLHYYKGKLNKKSFQNLRNLVLSIKGNCLIILHSRHIKNYKKYISDSFDIIFSPFNKNDDIYIIISSLLHQAKIISNDNFGDHNANYTNYSNLLRNYLDEKIINFVFNKKYILMNPKYSVVRFSNNNLIIPSEKGGFNIIKLNTV